MGEGGGSLIYDILASSETFVGGYTYAVYGSRHKK